MRRRKSGSWSTSGRGRPTWKRDAKRKLRRRRPRRKPMRNGEKRRKQLRNQGRQGSNNERLLWKSCRRFDDNLKRFEKISPRSCHRPQQRRKTKRTFQRTTVTSCLLTSSKRNLLKNRNEEQATELSKMCLSKTRPTERRPSLLLLHLVRRRRRWRR